MIQIGKILLSSLGLAWATYAFVASHSAFAASFIYGGGGLNTSSAHQASSGVGQGFAPPDDFTLGSGQLRLLQQSYLGYSPLVAEILLDGGAYGDKGGFYDTTGTVSWDYEGATSFWHAALQGRLGDDERGLIRRSLKEQFEGRFYSKRGQRAYQFMSAELFQRGQLGADWFTETYFLGQYLYRDLRSLDGLLQLKLGRMITPVWGMGVGGKGFAQWWDRAYTDSIGAYVFTEYEYFPEAKMTLLIGSGEARAQGTKNPSQLYGMSFVQPLARGRLETSYEKSQSAAAAGSGVNEEETTKIQWLHQLTSMQSFSLNGKVTREKQLTANLIEKRQREQFGAAYFYRWGRALKIGKDQYENEAALRYEAERWRQRGAGQAQRNSISASWSFLR